MGAEPARSRRTLGRGGSGHPRGAQPMSIDGSKKMVCEHDFGASAG